MTPPSNPDDPSPVSEIRSLIDDLFHGTIDNEGLQRIESLILQDQHCLQTYVEELDFHCELVEQADQTHPAVAAASGMKRYSEFQELKRGRQRVWFNVFFTLTSLLMAVGLGWAVYSVAVIRPQIGTVVSLSAQIETSTPLALGQILRKGETIQLGRGVVSIQFENVLVDLVGPVTATLTRSKRLTLKHGTVVAVVEPRGTGFSVSTPNGEIVDLGTEFLVRYTPSEGTFVSVRRGEVHAKSVDWRGVPSRVASLTTSRAAKIENASEAIQETAYVKDDYAQIDRSRGGIRQISGAIRTIGSAPTSLESEQLTTPNHMLVIPERQHVVLDEPLTVEALSGRVSIPKGATISSYLIHYDPTSAVSFAPRGSVTFFNEVAGIIVSKSGLTSTDTLFGLPEVAYESNGFRELELDEDEILISDDRKTVSFYWGVNPPHYLDQARVLVIHALQ